VDLLNFLFTCTDVIYNVSTASGFWAVLPISPQGFVIRLPWLLSVNRMLYIRTTSVTLTILVSLTNPTKCQWLSPGPIKSPRYPPVKRTSNLHCIHFSVIACLPGPRYHPLIQFVQQLSPLRTLGLIHRPFKDWLLTGCFSSAKPFCLPTSGSHTHLLLA